MRLNQLKRGVALGCLSLFLAAQTHALTVAEHQAAIIASSGSNQALSAAILEFPALTSDFIALAQANGSLIALDAASVAALETAGSQQAILGILSGSAAGSTSTLFLAALAAGAVYVATDDDEPASSGGTTDGGSTDGGNTDGGNTDGGGDDTTTLPLCSEATDPSKLTVDTDCRMGNAVGTFTADKEYNNVNLGVTDASMDFNVGSTAVTANDRPSAGSSDLVHPYTRIGVPEAYKRGLTGKGLKIAVLDGGFISGLSTTKFQTGPGHQELAGKVESVELEAAKNTNSSFEQQHTGLSRDTVEVESSQQGISHGTHVAALAAGKKDGKGMHGVAYEADLLLAEFSRLGAPDYDALVDEFTAKKVDVWNNSWGYSANGDNPPVDIQTNGQVEVGKLKTYIDNNNAVSFGDAMAATFGSSSSDWDNFVTSIENYQTKAGTNGKGGVVVWSNSNDGQADIDLGDSTTNLKDADVSSALPVLAPSIKGAWITVVNATDSETAKLVFGNRDLSAVTSVSDDKKTMVVSAICGSAAEFCLTADGVQVSSAVMNNSASNTVTQSTRANYADTDAAVSNNSVTDYYENQTGTSQAGPIVAGAVALLRQAFPNMSAKDITTRLFVTADHSKLGETTGTANFTTDSGATLSHGYSTIFGHGWVDLSAALAPVGSLTVATTGSARNVSLSQLGNIAVGKAMSSGVRVSLADAAFLTQDVMGAGFQATLEGRASFDTSNYIDDQITAFEQNIQHKDVSLGDSVSLSFASSTEASLDSDTLLAEGVRLNFSHGNGSSSTVGFGGDLNDAMDTGLSLSAQDVVVSSTQNDAFDIGYLSLTDDDKIWSSHKLSNLDLVVGNFATVDDAYESVGVIASQSFRPSAKSNIRLSVGSMTEQGGILGTKIDGFLGAGKASTSFVQLKGQQSLGAKTALTVSYSTALSKIDTQAGSFFTGFDDMRSESMAIGVNHNHILTHNDSLNLSLSSPLRTTAGSADLTMATSLSADNRIGFETRKLSFVPTGREVRLGLGYGASLAPGNKFELGAMAISQPGHDAAADDEFGGFFKVKQAF